MRIVDVAALCTRAKAAGAQVAVDNTFLSPALQQPIALGADFVIHSTTKYLNGHSDVVGGAVVTAARSDLDALASWANTAGLTGAPFDAYLTLRGIRTLFPRIEAQQRSAQRIAEYLHDHSKVGTVYYPGLPTHPGHAVAAVQQAGFGAMLSFTLKGGPEAARGFANAVRLFTLAESLGGIESLVAHPATMTHAAMGAEARKRAGIGDDLFRLSVGLEASDDLLADLDQALAAAG
jgi:cystathionine gamma-synthase